jgi:glycosyltransferase involved in cell wall biosynthesis
VTEHDGSPLFTVFTPTYNRAHTLARVWDSLRKQTFRDFEWLVVDDGSTDGTAELIEGWRREAEFPVRYVHQPNGGKHTAFNRGVAEAAGQVFMSLDSDDECFPEALERFAHHWHAIPADERAGFSGVTALCSDPDGNIVGERFPYDPTDSDALELRYRYRVGGEKWGFNRVDVLRQHPFPVVPGQPNVPESLVWDRIARHYRTRFVNEALRTYYVQGADSITAQTAARIVRRAPAFALRNHVILDEELDWFRFAPQAFLRAAVNYTRFSSSIGVSFADQRRALQNPRARLLHAALAPVGLALGMRDRRRATRD